MAIFLNSRNGIKDPLHSDIFSTKIVPVLPTIWPLYLVIGLREQTTYQNASDSNNTNDL